MDFLSALAQAFSDAPPHSLDMPVGATDGYYNDWRWRPAVIPDFTTLRATSKS